MNKRRENWFCDKATDLFFQMRWIIVEFPSPVIELVAMCAKHIVKSNVYGQKAKFTYIIIFFVLVCAQIEWNTQIWREFTLGKFPTSELLYLWFSPDVVTIYFFFVHSLLSPQWAKFTLYVTNHEMLRHIKFNINTINTNKSTSVDGVIFNYFPLYFSALPKNSNFTFQTVYFHVFWSIHSRHFHNIHGFCFTIVNCCVYVFFLFFTYPFECDRCSPLELYWTTESIQQLALAKIYTHRATAHVYTYTQTKEADKVGRM